MINFLRALCAVFFAVVIGGCSSAESDLPPLHQAALDDDTAEVKRLIDGGADVNAKTPDGSTPLHLAGAETAFILSQAGADVNAKDESGKTPLHLATWFGKIESVIVLVGAKADVNAKDNDGKTPMHYAAGENPIRAVLSLMKDGADTRTEHTMITKVQIAAGKSQVETVFVLVKAGADLHARDDDGETPLDIAIKEHGKDSIISIFLHGAMFIHSAAEKQGNAEIKLTVEELRR